MSITLENAAADFSRSVNGIPPIDTQRAVTSVLVPDGETTVIGGIFTSREQTVEDRTPVLHQIPLLGWLFKRDVDADESRELLIFITPRITKAVGTSRHAQYLPRSIPSPAWPVVASTLGLASCASEFTRTGSSPAFVIIESLLGASGAEPDRFGSPLLSDVVTLVKTKVNGVDVSVPTYFNDLAQVRMSIALKNPGTSLNPTRLARSTRSRFTRYHVDFRRTDGRNTPGVDVPHPFRRRDRPMTIPTDGWSRSRFEVVRNQAKLESPLANLRRRRRRHHHQHDWRRSRSTGAIRSATKSKRRAPMSVNFADFADPEEGDGRSGAHHADLGITIHRLAGAGDGRRVVHRQGTEAPALVGPLRAGAVAQRRGVTRSIFQDGASQSSITIDARGPNSQPARGVTLRVDMAVGSAFVDFGRCRRARSSPVTTAARA